MAKAGSGAGKPEGQEEIKCPTCYHFFSSPPVFSEGGSAQHFVPPQDEASG